MVKSTFKLATSLTVSLYLLAILVIQGSGSRETDLHSLVKYLHHPDPGYRKASSVLLVNRISEVYHISPEERDQMLLSDNPITISFQDSESRDSFSITIDSEGLVSTNDNFRISQLVAFDDIFRGKKDIGVFDLPEELLGFEPTFIAYPSNESGCEMKIIDLRNNETLEFENCTEVASNSR